MTPITILKHALPVSAKAPRWLLVALVATTPWAGQADEIGITITFADNCPSSVSLDDVTLTKNRDDRILWTAVQDDQPYTGGFDIYFDPFKSGPPLKSGYGGDRSKLRSEKLHDHVPLAEYKYTIVGDECASAPLDPRIRVQ